MTPNLEELHACENKIANIRFVSESEEEYSCLHAYVAVMGRK